MKPFPKMNSNNTTLLIVDVINSSAHEKCEIPKWGIHFTKIRKMVPKLNKFVKEFRKTIDGTIIFSKTCPWRKEYLADNINELYGDKRFAYYNKDTSGFSEQFYDIKPEEGDLVFDIILV